MIQNNKCKVLLIDLETSPITGYSWNLWETNILDIKKDWYILSFAYKWLGDSKVTAKALPMYKGYGKDKENDLSLCEDLWVLFDQADVIVAHNGQAFDVKKSNARFVTHGFKPPSPYKIVDTKLVAKKYFKFESNKLDNLGKSLGLGEKLETGGFSTWLGCMAGDKNAWDKMIKYNKQDVVLLEKVYLRLRDWIVNHPRITDKSINEACANCGSTHIQKRGTMRNKTTTLQRLHCQGCGAWHSVKIEKDVL